MLLSWRTTIRGRWLDQFDPNNLVNFDTNRIILIRIMRIMHGKHEGDVAHKKFQGIKDVIRFTVIDVNAERLERLAPAQLTQFIRHCGRSSR